MKRILLVADIRGWIFERHCLEIQKRLTEYHIDIAYHNEDIALLSKDYDLVYVLDPMPLRYPPQNKTIMGLRCEWLYRQHPHGAKGLYEEGLRGRCVSIKDRCCIFHVVNRRQLKEFEPIVTDKPLLLVQHGVDETCFAWEAKIPNHNKLVVGAVGRANSDGQKGFDVIQRECARFGLEYHHASYSGQRLTKEEMPYFYKQLDIFVSLSATEGLCNPILEAGAMGVPIISTDAGAAPEIIENGVNGLLIDRNKLGDAFMLMMDKSRRESMSKKMHQRIMEQWIWAVRIEDFRKMFGLFFERK